MMGSATIKEIIDFAEDHYNTFDCYPIEIETSNGNVYSFDQYIEFVPK